MSTSARRDVRPDASMTLLNDVTEMSLDPGYAKAAATRGARVRPAAQALTLGIAAALALITVWSVQELRAPQPQAAANRALIEKRIEDRSTAVERRQGANAALRREISQAQSAVVGRPLTEQIAGLAVAAGEVPVRGPGLRLTIDNATSSDEDVVGGDPRDQTDAAEGDVLDRDLQVIVNALWGAGAEAISVNDQRLSGLSAIRSAGQAILVDFRPLIPPYVISVIGDAAKMQAGFAVNGGSGYVQLLRDNVGIEVSIAAVDDVKLPGAGELALTWAKPQRSSSSSSGTSPSFGRSPAGTSSRPGASTSEVSP